MNDEKVEELLQFLRKQNLDTSGFTSMSFIRFVQSNKICCPLDCDCVCKDYIEYTEYTNTKRGYRNTQCVCCRNFKKQESICIKSHNLMKFRGLCLNVYWEAIKLYHGGILF